MDKETIKQMQRLLAAIGYSPGDIDGIWGNLSKAALDAACKAHGVGKGSNVSTNVPEINSGDFWKDIKYFSRNEFRCPCGKCNGFPAEPVEKLIRIADKVRIACGAPAHVSSGVRCFEHNAEVGGVATSRHLKGWAMDFCVDGKTATELDAIVGAQIGVAYHYKIDDRFVHMDVVL